MTYQNIKIIFGTFRHKIYDFNNSQAQKLENYS